MNLGSRTILRILCNDLEEKAYKKYAGCVLNVRLKRIKLERSKVLKR